jgi:hypothetical protein
MTKRNKHKNWDMALVILAAIVVCWAVSQCGCSFSPTAPSAVIDTSVISQYWSMGIEQLKEAGVVTTLVWGDFEWRAVDDYFDCGGVRTSGCYDSSTGVIYYNIQEPDAIRHETGHAVLHRMGYSNWREWQHDKE